MVSEAVDAQVAWWEKNLDDIDREILRLSAICRVHILDSGVLDRVLQDDPSVCASPNPAAFDKLRHAVTMHYQIRAKAVAVLGEAKTAALIGSIVDRLRARYGGALGGTVG